MVRLGNHELPVAIAPTHPNDGNRIGLFGGTFNPIHCGHLRAAEEVRECFNLEKVIFIPARVPPHKHNEPIVTPEHRLTMVRLAIRNNPAFDVSSLEIKRDAPSYSILTIEHFREKCGPEAALFFLMGMDSFLEISTWRECARLFSLADFIVMTRPGYTKKEISQILTVDVAKKFYYNSREGCYIHSSRHRLYFQEITLLEISSRAIRARIKDQGSLRYLVLPVVERYIKKHNLYAT